MLNSRKSVKKALKVFKRQEDVKFGEILCKALSNGDQAGFWHTLQTGRRPNICGLAVQVGNAINDDDISLWANHFGSIVTVDARGKEKKER